VLLNKEAHSVIVLLWLQFRVQWSISMHKCEAVTRSLSSGGPRH